MAYQCRDVVEAMILAAGQSLIQLHADGGASSMDLLLQIQADQCGVPVTRPRATEVTAVGAAMLAGLTEGVWSSAKELRALAINADVFEPEPRRARADADHAAWRKALDHAARTPTNTGLEPARRPDRTHRRGAPDTCDGPLCPSIPLPPVPIVTEQLFRLSTMWGTTN
jgi:glycerol kinase